MFIATQVILQYTVQGVPYTLAKFEVDTAANLPQSLETFKISIGSEAHVIDTNSKYCMGANDTWVLQNSDGTAGYTKEEIDQLIQGAKDYTDSEITDMDVPSTSTSGHYIKSIAQVDGLIVPVADTIQTSVIAGSTHPVTGGAVKTYADTAATDAVNSWFLRGPIIPSGTDFNTLTTPGHYYVNSNEIAGTMTNMPVSYGGRLEITATIGNTSYLRQTYYANTDSVGLICIRRQNSSDTGWSKWVIFPEAFGTGTTITATSSKSFDIDTIDIVGRYTYSATSAPYILGLPSNALTTVGGEIIVENVQNTNRFIMRLYLNGQSQAGRFWQRFYTLLTSTTAGWTPWYMFEGTQVV